jgi:uncharacterized membrane protein YfcA
MTETIQFIILGLAAGILSGLLGIGGAIIIVPILVYFFGFDQKMAQGTTLAMLLPPVGLLGVWQYYNAGNVNLKVAGIMCIGLFVGAYFGGYLANQVSSDTLRKFFGVVLLLVSIKMIFGK